MVTKRPDEDQAIELWLKQSLADRYASTLRERLPQTLIDLLREDHQA